MTAEEMKLRTKSFALRVIKLVEALPGDRTAEVVGKQLLRSGTPVGANHRAACRAKSTADFIAKMGVVEKEADECAFWLEMIVESDLMKKERIEGLADEANQIAARVVSLINTARGNKR